MLWKVIACSSLAGGPSHANLPKINILHSCSFLLVNSKSIHGQSTYINTGLAGIEPVTSAVTGQRSNQLSYNPLVFFTSLRFQLLYSARHCYVCQIFFSTFSEKTDLGEFLVADL